MCHLIISPPGNGFNLPSNMEIYTHYHSIIMDFLQFNISYLSAKEVMFWVPVVSLSAIYEDIYLTDFN